MKKIAMTIAIVLGLSMTTFADQGGLFQRGSDREREENVVYGNREGGFPGMPGHGQSGNQDAPLGTGIALLTAFGAAYLVGKKRNEK